jgi:hypothetical protein
MPDRCSPDRLPGPRIKKASRLTTGLTATAARVNTHAAMCGNVWRLAGDRCSVDSDCRFAFVLVALLAEIAQFFPHDVH